MPEILGDVNDQGAINIVDSLLVAKYYVNIKPAGCDAPVVDANLDDVVNIINALLIARYYVGLKTELPEEKPCGYIQRTVSSTNILTAYYYLAGELFATQP